jgi:hypothetical protein
MFGIQAIVAVVQHHVRGERMIPFVKRRRRTMDEKHSQEALNGDERNNSSPKNASR